MPSSPECSAWESLASLTVGLGALVAALLP